MNKEKYSFFNLGIFCLAITLISISSLFIKRTLSTNEVVIQEKKFDIYLVEPMFINETKTSLITTDNRIDISLNLNNTNSDASFITNINNAGDFAGTIKSIEKTDLSKITIGYIDNKEVNLSDYIEFEILDGNNTLKENRNFDAKTNSDILVVLKKKIVNKEYEELLNSVGYGENINIDLYINIDFQQV